MIAQTVQASIGRMIVRNALERIWEEDIVAEIKYFSGILWRN
jgi:hypothetical protein